MVDELEQLREAAPAREIGLDGVAEEMRDVVRYVLANKARTSHQATVATAHLTRERDGIRARFRQCGDSGVIVWSPQGSPTWSNLWISDATPEGAPSRSVFRFDQRSSTTPVLPDHREAFLAGLVERRLDLDAVVMIGTDGFFDAFDLVNDAWDFFRRHQHAKSPDHVIAGEIHERLRARKGDDDVTVLVARLGQK